MYMLPNTLFARACPAKARIPLCRPATGRPAARRRSLAILRSGPWCVPKRWEAWWSLAKRKENKIWKWAEEEEEEERPDAYLWMDRCNGIQWDERAHSKKEGKKESKQHCPNVKRKKNKKLPFCKARYKVSYIILLQTRNTLHDIMYNKAYVHLRFDSQP